MKEESYKLEPPNSKTTTTGYNGAILAKAGSPPSSKNSGKSLGICGSTTTAPLPILNAQHPSENMLAWMHLSLLNMKKYHHSQKGTDVGFVARKKFSTQNLSSLKPNG